MARSSRLAANQLRALAKLSRAKVLDDFYLAGGAAIGVHLGHRTSLDLDLFSLRPDVDLATVERRLQRAIPDLTVVDHSDAALTLKIAGASVDVVAYPYPPLREPRRSEELGIRVAGLMDLAVMKLAVTAQRGLRRDYWDLYALLKSGLAIEEVGRAFRKRFGVGAPDLYHVARALGFFEDTERDRHLPRGLTPPLWRAIKEYLAPMGGRLLALGGRPKSGGPTPRRRRSKVAK